MRRILRGHIFWAFGVLLAMIAIGDFVRDIRLPWRHAASISIDAPTSTTVSPLVSVQIPSRQQPRQARYRSPLEVLNAHKAPLPELKNWATDWESGAASDVTVLKNLVDKSDLNSAECLQIGRMVARGGEFPASEVWIAAGIKLAQSQLAGAHLDEEMVRPIRSALGQATDVMWGDEDGGGPYIEQMTLLLMHCGRANDQDHTPESARIHHAQALLMNDKYSEAADEADAMTLDEKTNPHWTNDLRSELRSLLEQIPFEPKAKTPLDVLQSHPSRLSPQLMAWGEAWSSPYGQSDLPEATVLSGMIERSDLSAMECLRITRLIEDAKDLPTAGTWAAISANRATAQLLDYSHSERSVMPMMEALMAIEDPLWDLPGNPSDRGELLEHITSLLMRFDPQDGNDHRIERARIEHGESLYLQERYSEALAECTRLAHDAIAPNSRFNQDDRIGINWLYALIYFDTKQYNKAIPYLNATADADHFYHSKDAWGLWAISLARTGDILAANSVFDEWIRRRKPTVEAAAPVLEIIQHKQNAG